jgi:hypothetical protein
MELLVYNIQNIYLNIYIYMNVYYININIDPEINL